MRAETSNFIKEEALAQVFSSEFWEISKNIFFTDHLRRTAPKVFAQSFQFPYQITSTWLLLYTKKNCYAEIVAPVTAKYSNRKNDEFHRFIKQIAIPLALKEFCSRSQMLFKINVLSSFANFTGKHLCCSLFLIKLQAWGLRPY